MRVLHLCLSCFYIDDAGYQENQLVRQHVDDGHDVLVIASTEVFDGKGGLTFAKPGSYLGSDGARVIRLPYTKCLPHKIGWKLRIHAGVYKLIEEFSMAVPATKLLRLQNMSRITLTFYFMLTLMRI